MPIAAGFGAEGNRFVGQDIVLPIGTDDYQELYDRFRNKSLLLLAGAGAAYWFGLIPIGGEKVQDRIVGETDEKATPAAGEKQAAERPCEPGTSRRLLLGMTAR